MKPTHTARLEHEGDRSVAQPLGLGLLFAEISRRLFAEISPEICSSFFSA